VKNKVITARHRSLPPAAMQSTSEGQLGKLHQVLRRLGLYDYQNNFTCVRATTSRSSWKQGVACQRLFG